MTWCYHVLLSFFPEQIYMINLERRSERRERMLHVFDVLGIEAEWLPAVDGKYVPGLGFKLGCKGHLV